jgi:hypothetical protein
MTSGFRNNFLLDMENHLNIIVGVLYEPVA